MFSTDRDLLALEPQLFREQQWLSQMLVSATGTLSSGLLTLTTSPLTGASIAPGHVVIVGRTPMEVLAVPASNQLGVSLPRADTALAAITPQNATNVPVAIMTFAPQRALVHAQLLRMLGVAAASSPQPGIPSESAITNPHDLKLIESLGTLHLIYSAAAAPLGDSSPAAQRARLYQDRFARERWRVHADIDLDADGLPDARRTLALTHLVRS